MNIVVWPQRKKEWIDAIRNAAPGAGIVTPANEGEALAAAPQADGWIGLLNPALLSAAKRLRWLQAPSISLERSIFPELAASDVTVTNFRNIQGDHIANHVMAFFLAFCRDMPRLARKQSAHEWFPKSDTEVRDPASMTVLVLGLGHIGSEITRRLAAFDCKVIGVDPKVSAPPAGVTELERPERLAELLPRADAVIVCAPLTPETTGLFDETMFRKMRPGSFFINVGRGKIVKLDALERALDEGWIAAAALDVYEIEPLPPTHSLWDRENVLLTPHVAGKGPHTEERGIACVVDNVRRFVAGEPLATVADKALWY